MFYSPNTKAAAEILLNNNNVHFATLEAVRILIWDQFASQLILVDFQYSSPCRPAWLYSSKHSYAMLKMNGNGSFIFCVLCHDM